MGDREISLCKELTKKHETNFRTTLSAAIAHYEQEEPKGEFVLVIEGISREELMQEEMQGFLAMTIEEHMQYYTDQGIDKKEAMKKVAKDRGVSKRDIYQALL